MAQSKYAYASTRETTNLARMARIILGPCTDVLRAVLRKEINPSVLPQKVKKYHAKQFLITKDQRKLIQKRNYSDFDITLLYILLRNISKIQPHCNQWGNFPSPTDTSMSANIERIRFIRNQYGHISKISMTDTDFITTWQQVHDIVQKMDMSLGTNYQDAVIDIKICSMDPEQESRYIEQLLGVHKKLKTISGNELVFCN